jgi:hypothetical protein
MRESMITAGLALAALIGASANPAAPQTTAQPGQMTPALVWVQNRSRSEAVAVNLRDVNLDKPLRVHVVNAEPVAGESTAPVQTRAARQSWEYATVAVPGGTDAATVLNAQGASGWEAVGVMSAAAGGTTTIVLKRPR